MNTPYIGPTPVSPILSALATVIGLGLILRVGYLYLRDYLTREGDRRENAGTEEGRWDP